MLPETFYKQKEHLDRFRSILLPITKIQTIGNSEIVAQLLKYPSVVFPIKGWDPSKIPVEMRMPILSFVATKQRHLIETISWCSKVTKDVEDINSLLLLEAWQVFDARCIHQISESFKTMPSVLPTFRKLKNSNYSNFAMLRFANLCYQSCHWAIQHDFDDGRDELLSGALKTWSNCHSNHGELAETLGILIGLINIPVKGLSPEMLAAWRFELVISALSRGISGSSEYSSALMDFCPPQIVSPYHSKGLLILLGGRSSTTGTVKWHDDWRCLPLTYDSLHWPDSFLPLDELLLRWQRKVLRLPPSHKVLREIDQLSHLASIMTPGEVYTHGTISVSRPHQFLQQTEAFHMISNGILDDCQSLCLSSDGTLLFNCNNPNGTVISLFFHIRLSLLALHGERLPNLPRSILSMVGDWKNACFPDVGNKAAFDWILDEFWTIVNAWGLPQRLLTL
jgi:hypothetical protein